MNSIQRTSGVLVALTLLIGTPALFVGPAHAAKCPPASVGGASIGSITAGGETVPIKPVTYKPGGTLRPPDTAKAVGLSTINAPLDATEGTTVMAWHVRFGKGCPGTLNTLLELPIGSKFTVSVHGSTAREYRITERFEVPRGKYKRKWFTPVGPHRLALFTCGDLRYEKFHSTIAVFAEPVT
jgi:hypothetical protein